MYNNYWEALEEGVSHTQEVTIMYSINDRCGRINRHTSKPVYVTQNLDLYKVTRLYTRISRYAV